MAYKKFFVDNLTCSRRFHLASDDEDPQVDHVEIKCPYCQKTIFSADGHAPVKLQRQENLVSTQTLSDRVIKGCEFRDTFSEKTVPGVPKEDYVYEKRK